MNPGRLPSEGSHWNSRIYVGNERVFVTFLTRYKHVSLYNATRIKNFKE